MLSDLQQAGAVARARSVDLPVLRRGVPREDAGVPAARLDARRLPRDAAAGARGVLRRAVEGRRLRLPADRAAALPRRRRRLPDAHAAPRARLDPLRVGDGVHDDRDAADPRLLVDRAARASSCSASSRSSRRARRARSCSRSTTASSSCRRSSSSGCWPRAPAARRTSATWAASRSARRCSRRCSSSSRWRRWRCPARRTSSASS